MYGLFNELLPPSGVDYVVWLRLIGTSSIRRTDAGQHLVMARGNRLRIFELREATRPESKNRSSRRQSQSENTTSESNDQGKISPEKEIINEPTEVFYKLHLLREHRLHGVVSGLQRVRMVSAEGDRVDRLLISFRDAKVALMEWSDVLYDLSTVSIHTYERTPQVVNSGFRTFKSKLLADPQHRCAALSLPRDIMAILPWSQAQTELELPDLASTAPAARSVPYLPSFIVDFVEIDDRLRNIIDIAFLPGFNNPTLAILSQPKQTWTGRLKELKDNVFLFIVTLDLVTRAHQITTTVANLPFDCLSISACATSIGGVIIRTPNAVLHVDQSAKIAAMALNGWASRATDAVSYPEEYNLPVALEGAHLAWLDSESALIALQHGALHILTIIHEGRAVSGFSLGAAIGQLPAPTVIAVASDHVFVGGNSASVLFKRLGESPTNSSTLAFGDGDETMDVDDDLYGAEFNVKFDDPDRILTHGQAKNQLVPVDALQDPGQILDITFGSARVGDRTVPELCASTGTDILGGFTLFQKEVPTRFKKKLHAVAGAKGLWSMNIKAEGKSSGRSLKNLSSSDTIVFSTDATPAPGVSRLATKGGNNDVTINARFPIVTIAAGPMFSNTHIVQVTTNSIRLLSRDGTEKQVIKDMDGNMTRPRIRSASIYDPFIIILREDDTMGLFIGERSKSKLRRKDMSMLGDRRSRYASASFYTDHSGLLRSAQPADHPPETPVEWDGGANSEREAKVENEKPLVSQWLVLTRPTGAFEIWTLPKLSLAFAANNIEGLQPSVVDSVPKPAVCVLDDDTQVPSDGVIDEAIIACVGEESIHPYLFLLFKTGILAVYRAVPGNSVVNLREFPLQIQFVKVFARSLDVQGQEEDQPTIPQAPAADRKIARRHLIPFSTARDDTPGLQGVFLTGDRPSWFTKTNQSQLTVIPSSYNSVHAFTSCPTVEGPNDFLMYTEEGPCLVELLPNVDLNTPLPNRRVRKGRSYISVAFDPSTQLVVAGSSLPRDFALYDDESNIVWEPDALSVGYPTLPSCSLELIDPLTWRTIDGYEFATNEVVNVVQSVTLETLSTEAGNKDFIAVATSVHRGEDLAVRGATYIFEVVEVVADIAAHGHRRHKLRLHCREDAKGPVTALCGMNGYLVSSMGQKVFVRAFDLDERLVGVAFMDVGVYVTALRCLKNLLLISDAVKSVWFVAFQEDPFKLIVLSKDMAALRLFSAEFFFAENDLFFLSADFEGVLRLHSYDPSHLETEDGTRLLTLCEFHTHTQPQSITTIARRRKGDPMAAPASQIVLAAVDGSLCEVIPIEDEIYKRLQLLQGQLSRNVQQVAGLNAKAFRTVPNDSVARPLLKGILDGPLLEMFEMLPLDRQAEMTRQIGSSRGVILRDLRVAFGGSGAW